jgi:hypothetical protein
MRRRFPQGFCGVTARLMFHWTDLVGRVPDIEARVLRSVEEGDTLWSDWEMMGTIADGVDLRAGGVAIL